MIMSYVDHDMFFRPGHAASVVGVFFFTQRDANFPPKSGFEVAFGGS